MDGEEMEKNNDRSNNINADDFNNSIVNFPDDTRPLIDIDIIPRRNLSREDLVLVDLNISNNATESEDDSDRSSFDKSNKKEWAKILSSKLGFIKNKHHQADIMRIMKNLEDCILLLSDKENRDVAFGSEHYELIIDIFNGIILRPLPPLVNPVGEIYDPEEDEPVFNLHWPLYSLVYDLFIRFLEIPEFDMCLARKFINLEFVYRLLNIFDAEDPRERESCKVVLHKVYGRFLSLRSPIRKAIRNVFYEFIYDDQRHNIGEVLEILGSIVNGFAIPLKEEHKMFLEKTLIPLHKHRALGCYFNQLCFCMVQYMEKDPSLSILTIHSLLKLWPWTNSLKQVMFIHELEEILEVTPSEYFIKVHKNIFERLADCITSPHFQVAERSLLMWNNEKVLKLFKLEPQDLVTLLGPPLSRIYPQQHWNKNMQLLIYNIIRILTDLNPRLYEEYAIKEIIYPFGLEESHDQQPQQQGRQDPVVHSKEPRNGVESLLKF